MFMHESILTVCFNSTAGCISSLGYDCVPGYRIGMMCCLMWSWPYCDLDFHCNDLYLACGRSIFMVFGCVNAVQWYQLSELSRNLNFVLRIQRVGKQLTLAPFIPLPPKLLHREAFLFCCALSSENPSHLHSLSHRHQWSPLVLLFLILVLLFLILVLLTTHCGFSSSWECAHFFIPWTVSGWMLLFYP